MDIFFRIQRGSAQAVCACRGGWPASHIELWASPLRLTTPICNFILNYHYRPFFVSLGQRKQLLGSRDGLEMISKQRVIDPIPFGGLNASLKAWRANLLKAQRHGFWRNLAG